jgi:hypothetical protein
LQNVTLWPKHIIPLAMQVGTASDAPDVGLQSFGLLPAINPFPVIDLQSTITYFDLWKYKTVYGQNLGDAYGPSCTVGPGPQAPLVPRCHPHVPRCHGPGCLLGALHTKCPACVPPGFLGTLPELRPGRRMQLC